MKSYKWAHYTLKYVSLVFGIVFIANSIITFSEVPISEFLYDEIGLIPGLFGILFIIIYLLIADRFVRVQFNPQTIEFKHKNNEYSVYWCDIISLKQIKLVVPPLYVLRIPDTNDFFLFTTGRSYIFVGITIDISEIGSLIDEKKKQFKF